MNSDLLEVSARLGKPLKFGYNTCIFCGRSKKLKVTSSYFRCFHPNCGEQGTTIDLIQKVKRCTAQEAHSFLYQGNGGNTLNWRKRITFLEKVFNQYKEAVTDEVLEYLNQRGYVQALEEIPFGFAPADNYLQSVGFRLDELVKHGLAYPNGQEFYQNRVIFGVHDLYGNLVHFQGRSVLEDAEVRWLSTPSKPEIQPINNYLFEGHYYYKRASVDWLFLAEGISDALSLIEINVPVVSCFGVQIDLCRFLPLFQKVSNLCVVLDNDRYPQMTKQAGLYKSWTPMIYSLVDLQKMIPTLGIWCCPPPDRSGVKDINDWLRSSPEEFNAYVQSHATRLFPFALQAIGHCWEHQLVLLKALEMDATPENLEKFREHQEQLEADVVQYLLKIIPYA